MVTTFCAPSPLLTLTGARAAGDEADVRPTPVGDSVLLASINAQLSAIDDRSMVAVLQVPEPGALRAAFYVNSGSGFSFMGWGEKLRAKPGLGFGVAIRKQW